MRIETTFGAEGPDNISAQFLIVDVLYDINRDRVATFEFSNEKIGRCIDAAKEAFKKEWSVQG